MKFFLTKSVIAAFILGCLFSCANMSEKKINKEIVNEDVTSPVVAVDEGQAEILQSKNLTADQKYRFMNVIKIARQQTAVVQEKQAKTLAVLFKSLSGGASNIKDVDILKKKLRKIQDERMNIILTSINEMRSIIGPNENIDSRFFLFERSYDLDFR